MKKLALFFLTCCLLLSFAAKSYACTLQLVTSEPEPDFVSVVFVAEPSPLPFHVPPVPPPLFVVRRGMFCIDGACRILWSEPTRTVAAVTVSGRASRNHNFLNWLGEVDPYPSLTITGSNGATTPSCGGWWSRRYDPSGVFLYIPHVMKRPK